MDGEIGGGDGGGGAIGGDFGVILGGLDVGLAGELEGGVGGGFGFPNESGGESSGFGGAELGFRAIVFGGLGGDLFGDIVLGFDGGIEGVFGGGEGGLGDGVEFALHFGAIGEFAFEFFEEIGGIFFHESGDFFGLLELLIEFGFDAEFFFIVAEAEVDLFALIESLVLGGDFGEGLDDILFFEGGVIEVGFLFGGGAGLEGGAEGEFGVGWGIFDEGEEDIGIAHAIALIFFEDILFVGVGADEIFEGFDAGVDLLLLGELGQSFRAILLGFGGGSGGGLFERDFAKGGFFFGEGEGEFANFGGEFADAFAGNLHGFAEEGEGRFDLTGDAIDLEANAIGGAIEFFAGEHFGGGGGEGFGGEGFGEESGGEGDGFEGVGIFEGEGFEFGGDHLDAGGDPGPIARRDRAGLWGAEFPAFDGAEGGEAIDEFLEVMAALEDAEALADLVEVGGGFCGAIGGGELADGFEGGGGAAEIADEGVIGDGARFFEIASGFDGLASGGPAGGEEGGAIVFGELIAFGEGGGFEEELIDGEPSGIDLVVEGSVDEVEGIGGAFGGSGDGGGAGFGGDGLVGEERFGFKEEAQAIRHGLGVGFDGGDEGFFVGAGGESGFDVLTIDDDAVLDGAGLFTDGDAEGAVIVEGFEKVLDIFADADHGLEADLEFGPIFGGSAGEGAIEDALAFGGEDEGEFGDDVDFLGGEGEVGGFFGEFGEGGEAGGGF